MADAKITQLGADSTPTTDDLVVTVNDPSGTPANKKVTVGDLLAHRTQTDNSGSISSATTSGLIVQYGWGQFQGSVAATITDTVTFPTAFTTPMGVITNWLGANATAVADITGFTAEATVLAAAVQTYNISTTGFTIKMNRISGNFGTSFYGYSWIAWGV